MSEITRLSITAIRNIESAEFHPIPGVNVLVGPNGSGKTSVLESIHLLATGKSFRSAKVDPLINQEADTGVVFVELASGYHIGLSKSRRQNHQLHFQDQAQRNWETVARELPVQLLDSNAFLLLEGGPRSRRRFLDWGVFHVEQSFVDSWRRSSKCLANRNHLLKQKRIDTTQLAAWDAELSEAAAAVDRSRQKYFEALLPEFRRVYQQLDPVLADLVSVQYLRGWDVDRDLSEVLFATMDTDVRYGATQNGPHRAELEIKIGKNRAIDILSRGQQKILVSALKIAQGGLMSSALGRSCVYLADDLPAELDKANRGAVMRMLIEQSSQLFVTCVDRDGLKAGLPDSLEMAMFHVERGTITT